MFELFSLSPFSWMALAVVAVIFFVRWGNRPANGGSPDSSASREPLAPSPRQLREKNLRVVRREISLALNGGNIRRDTYEDMDQYLNGQAARLAEPTPPAVPMPPLASFAQVFPPSETSVAERKEAPSTPLAGVAPHATPVQPAVAHAAVPEARMETPIMLESSNRKPEAVIAKEKSWAERFFTPENVRILQSLGIGIIFLSAVAFVRSEMWNGASGWAQLGMLVAGTLCCSGLGILLLRLTNLRLTGLCFLILGQLSLLVDLYAARVFHAPSGELLYTHSDSSLWTIGFIVFSATAYLQARWIKESLFEAFTYFGALAAWGAGMHGTCVEPELLPASFVPVLLVSSILARNIAGVEPQRRWSLPWWLTSGVSLAAPVLCIALPVAALWSGQAALARDFHWHALAILLLAAALLKEAFFGHEIRAVHVPAVLLLAIAPLGVYAFNGTTQNSDYWPLALTLPGLLFAVFGMLASRNSLRKTLLDQIANWGLTALLLGFAVAIPVWGADGPSAFLVVSFMAVAVAGLFRAILQSDKAGPWLFGVASAFALTQVFHLNRADAETYLLGAFLLASALHALWFMTKKWLPNFDAVAKHGIISADVLCTLTAVPLVLGTLLYGIFGGALSTTLYIAWPALAAYVLFTSMLSQKPLRRWMGILLLGMAVFPPQFTLASLYIPVTPSLALTAGLATLLALFLHGRENNPKLLKSGLYGAGAIIAYGTVMGFVELVHGRTLNAGIGLIMMSISLASLALLLRGKLDLLRRACFVETLALLQLGLGLAVIANYIGVTGEQWSMAGTMIAALVLLAGLALDSLSGPWLGEKGLASPSPFLESRTIAVAIIGALALLDALAGNPLHTAHLDMAWRNFFSISLLTLYFSFANSSRNSSLNSAIRWGAAVLAYCALIPATYLLFLKAHSTGSSWGALWFLGLAPVLMIAGNMMRREKEAGLANVAFAGSALVACGSLLLAFTNNRANLAGVPCATLLGIGALALVARRILYRIEFSAAACVALTCAAFYGLRAICGSPAWMAHAPNVWEMPFMTLVGMTVLWVGGRFKVEPLEAPRENESLLSWHGLIVSITAAAFAMLNLTFYGSRVKGGMLGNTGHLDAFIIVIALLAPVFLLARRHLQLSAGRHWASACAGLAYVMQVWKAQPAAWEWYTLPLAVFLFVSAWEMVRSEKVEGSVEVNGLLGLGSALALLPSFIQGLPWNANDLWHVLTLAVIGFAMVFTALATRRKVPLLSASGTILICLLVHAIHLAMHRQMMLPVGGLIAGFSVLAVASLFESRMNANLRSAVDRARAEARMFWTSWN